MSTLLAMPPDAFERLAQRILRESGFTHVEVTGRSGDGGIDGKGMMRLGGILSFHVIFQCKRYKGSVPANHIRDFRGAMVGRTNKGLFITTGNFTKDAVREATRDGAPPIDLIDGDQLIDKLRELCLGVTTRIIETKQMVVDASWFESFGSIAWAIQSSCKPTMLQRFVQRFPGYRDFVQSATYLLVRAHNLFLAIAAAESTQTLLGIRPLHAGRIPLTGLCVVFLVSSGEKSWHPAPALQPLQSGPD